MAVTIYHNPRCSKSRAALDLLREQGVDPKVVEYLKEPPSAAALDGILKAMGRELRDVLRTQEEPYRALVDQRTRLGLGEERLLGGAHLLGEDRVEAGAKLDGAAGELDVVGELFRGTAVVVEAGALLVGADGVDGVFVEAAVHLAGVAA
ncbi:MAG: hypothetical protein FJX64_10310 [Alphaproteobacteria bacterium]|nr:hypothetical protein [Alphaproteobacteria bacterium]